MISFFSWLSLILIFATVLTVIIIYYRRVFGKETVSAPPPDNSAALRKKLGKKLEQKTRAGVFTEKLGEKVVRYMIEVAGSADRAMVLDRMEKIRQECERLNSIRDLPGENKRIISTVLIWAKKFNIDRHINDMAILQKSNQIIYDAKKRDFKLLISGD